MSKDNKELIDLLIGIILFSIGLGFLFESIALGFICVSIPFFVNFIYNKWSK